MFKRVLKVDSRGQHRAKAAFKGGQLVLATVYGETERTLKPFLREREKKTGG